MLLAHYNFQPNYPAIDPGPPRQKAESLSPEPLQALMKHKYSDMWRRLNVLNFPEDVNLHQRRCDKQKYRKSFILYC